MKQFLCLFLIGVFGCFCAGCGQTAVEQPTEQEEQDDLKMQEEMMNDMEPK